MRALWEDLDGYPDIDVDAAWLDEVQRRSKEIDDGLVECVPAEDVFSKLESLIRK